MGIEQFSEYGVAIFAIAAISFIVIKFLSSLAQQRDAFGKIIQNHIEHNTSATEKNTEALVALKETTKELGFYVKKSNGHTK